MGYLADERGLSRFLHGYHPMSSSAETVVGIFNTSQDTIDMLRELFEHKGFVAVAVFTNTVRDGKVDLDGWMRQHRPSVIVYDIALPYDENWRLFEHIRDSPACKGLPFVLTTTNVAQVKRVAGDAIIYEIVGKPYDLEKLLDAVSNAASQRR
jgi:CheY-like chemotaxis protein